MKEENTEVLSKLREDVISRIDMSRDVSDEEIRSIIKEEISALKKKTCIGLNECCTSSTEAISSP